MVGDREAEGRLRVVVEEFVSSGAGTFTAISLAAGITKEYLYRIRKGHQHPSLDIADRIAKACGRTVTFEKWGAKNEDERVSADRPPELRW